MRVPSGFWTGPPAIGILCAVALAGCKPSSPSSHAAGEDEEKTAQITVWGERFEVFAEHPMVVAGAATAFVTHVTDLRTSEPRREGPVSFVLRQGTEAPLEHPEADPKRAGIYIPELRFPKPGAWTVTLRIPVDGGESLVELPPVTAYASREEARQAPEPEAPEGVGFLKEQQWKLLTKTEPAIRRTLTERVRAPAVVAAPPASRAAVAPPVAGRLLPPGDAPFPSIGDRVERGQTLALVQPPFSDFAARLVEADADVIRKAVALEQAERTHERVRKLAEEKAKSVREAEEAESALKTARADHEAAVALKAAYGQSGAVLRDDGVRKLPVFEIQAPIAGIVTSVTASIGEHVAADRAVLTILDTETVYLEARVPESDATRLAGTAGAVYETPDARGRFLPIPGEGGGKLVLVSPEVDPGTRTVSLLYEMKNPEGRLRVGMALTLHVETARAGEALAIPVSAVVDEDTRPVAFVQVAGETFQKRPLTLGIRDGDWVQVLDGIAVGERVVTREAFAIRLASVSSVIPAHGHAH